MEGVGIREVADFHGAGGASAEVGVVDRLSLCLRHRAPQGITAIGPSAFLKGCGHYPLDPGRCLHSTSHGLAFEVGTVPSSLVLSEGMGLVLFADMQPRTSPTPYLASDSPKTGQAASFGPGDRRLIGKAEPVLQPCRGLLWNRLHALSRHCGSECGHGHAIPFSARHPRGLASLHAAVGGAVCSEADHSVWFPGPR